MARDNRLRLSDDEEEDLEEAARVMFGEDLAEELPLGKAVGDAANFVIEHYEELEDD